MEVALLWPMQWNTAKILFFFNRYLIVGDFILIVFRDQVPGMARYCPIILQATLCGSSA